MENEQNAQAMPAKANGRSFQWLPIGASSQSVDDGGDEGGLNLGQVFASLRRRLPVIAGVTTVVTSAAVLKALTSVPIYQSSFEILAKPITAESQVISSVPQTLTNKEQEQASAGGVDATTLKLLKSPRILSPIVKKLKQKYPGITYDELAVGVVVTPLPSSEILTIGFQDKQPDKVKDVLQAVSEAYLQYSLEERLSDVRQGIDFVNAQLPQLQKRVEDIQDNLQRFRQQYNLIDPESTSKRLADQTSTIGQQRLETQVKLNEARALYTDLNRQLSRQEGESAASSALTGNTRYQTLLNQLLEVESQIAKESSLFREDTAAIRVLKDQRQNLLPLLEREGQRVQEEVASRIRELEARNQVLAQTEAGLGVQVKQLSVISRQYADFQQELKIATENLNQFLTKREALRIDAGQRKAPWQILTPPAEPIPSAANAKRSALLGAILGVLMGIGVALLLEKLSNVLHTPEEAKDVTKLPILGVIPLYPELDDGQKPSLESGKPVMNVSGIIHLNEFLQQMRQQLPLKGGAKASHYTASPFLEAFRSTYTNIRLLNSDTHIRSLVITSATPGEGKSTVSIHLARAASALGQRVLLVDTDLRLPQLHNRLQLPNSYGLSNLIASDLPFDRLILQSPIEENLYVLTAGQIPPDPTKLLSSQKMQSLMEQFTEHFDLVIYDTPPLGGLADARLVAMRTDGIILIVGLGKVKTASVSRVLAELKQFPVSLLGMIANRSKNSGSELYGNYHYYYHPDTHEESAVDIVPSISKQSND